MRLPRFLPWLDSKVVVLALFAVLSILMTLPLALDPAGSLPNGAGDIRQNYWNFWWWEQALLELGTSPYHTPLLYHPHGVDLIFHTHSPFNMVVGLPFQVAFGPAAAYNFCLLLALTLSGYGAWLLVRRLTGDGAAGVLAGLVFAYFPNHVEQTFEHVNLFSIQFLPWALYYLVRTVEESGRRNVLGLAVTFALNALASWHLGLMLILVAAPYWLIRAVARRDELGRIVLRTAAAAALAAVLLAPAAGPLVAEIAAGARYYQKDPTARGIDAAYLLTPHYGQPLGGRLVAERYIDRAYQAAGFVCYLGFLPLGLAAVALWRRAPGRGFWLGLTLVSLVLAMGKNPWWNGELLEITLPFAVFEHLPLFSVLRVANRFLLLTGLGLAVLTGLAWTALRNRSPEKFALLAGLVFLEYLWTPYPIHRVETPPAYQRMLDGAILRIGAVLDIPFGQRSRSAQDMIGQTVHGRPIVAGYVSTTPPEAAAAIENEPALADLAGVPKLERPIDFRRLVQLGVDTVILHKRRAESYRERLLEATPRHDIAERKRVSTLGGVPDATFAEIRRQLVEHNGPAVFEDEQIEIYYLRSGFGSTPD